MTEALGTIFMTGATSGLGKAAACNLANKGYKLVATARNKARGQQLIDFFNENYPERKGSIEIIECDLSSFESIINAVKAFKNKHSNLDILINNAAVWNFNFKKSKNQIEETFHVNVLAPILLINLFGELLNQSTNARIINTASSLHNGIIDFNDIEQKQNFNGFNTYRQSKLSIILLTRLLANEYKKTNISLYSLHPGVVSTNIARQGNAFFQFGIKLIGATPEKGAQTIVYLSTAPKENLSSGEYYSKKKISRSKPKSNDLELATQLLKVIDHYLNNYKEPTLLYK